MKRQRLRPPRVATAWAPKKGNTDAQYEDAFTTNEWCFAVADGATESYLSGKWAKRLADAFCFSARVYIDDVIVEAQEGHDGFVRAFSAAREAAGQPLRWYDDQKLTDGAYATLLAVYLFPGGATGNGGHWRAVGMGDTCLFHVRQRACLRAFPVADSSLFSTSPALLSSRAGPIGEISLCEADWESGDVLYLMTDALAAWALREVEEARVPWGRLDRVLSRGPESLFRDWIAAQRARGELKNDDVTVLRLRLP